MPQIFRPSTNTIAKASILALLLVGAGLVAALVIVFTSPITNKVGVAIEQPVAFSHEHHVSGLGINCLYCHNTVEESSFAGLPPTHTCMSCHSQIWANAESLQLVRTSFETGEPIPWVRVNDLPDHTYFNHAIHVNKGIGCESCHGRVDQMQLTSKSETMYMSWCLDCHREPEKHVRPVAEVYTMGYQPEEPQEVLGPRLVEEYDIQPGTVLDDCYICHR